MWALRVDCPHCGALAGGLCLTRDGKQYGGFHLKRRKEAYKLMTEAAR